jgi:hypothetical protein
MGESSKLFNGITKSSLTVLDYATLPGAAHQTVLRFTSRVNSELVMSYVSRKPHFQKLCFLTNGILQSAANKTM